MPSKTPRPGVRRKARKLPARKRAKAQRHQTVITIDGPAGSGKSTVAKLLAKALGLMYLDTGATYRALAFAVENWQPDAISDITKLAAAAQDLPLRLKAKQGGALCVFLGGVEITREIRSQEVSQAAAQISQYPEVRAAMVNHQRELAKGMGVVVEGRDTGSVVFPDASFKFFIDADLTVRAERRRRELGNIYGEEPPVAEVRSELRFRDNLDRYRPVGALVKPKGAVVVDTTNLSAQQVMRFMLKHITRDK